MQVPKVDSPRELKALTSQQTEALIPVIREQIIQAVSHTGGHLASNLGMVELTVALHRVLDTPRDKIVFDVGHQCYAHKILTGRGPLMGSLRQFGGISGFPKREESPHDSYDTGHASTAISAALGLARARDLQGGQEHVVAVVGDGALTGGLCYEALNDAGSSKTRLLVILNDNQMSISPVTGALGAHLTFLRTSKGWLGAKKAVGDLLLKLPLGGKWLHRLLYRFKNHIRNIFVRDGFFQSLGFRYLGPIDGHDESGLERALQRALRYREPVLLHVVTRKGKGYSPAEEDPSKAHGMPAFHPQDGSPKVKPVGRSFGAVAGQLLCMLAEEDPSLVVVTAAMTDSTGLGPFKQRYPNRLFDVGIAEGHAVTLAAGLAAGGLRPVVAIYDTFMQRAYDQVIVDVSLQNLPVCFLIDRAAIGGEDGPTHHGVFGTAMLRHIPGITLLAPRSADELQHMLRWALKQKGPVAIRYPRAEQVAQAMYPCQSFAPGHWEQLEQGQHMALVATGPMVGEAFKTRKALERQGVQAALYNAGSIKPLDTALLHRLSDNGIPYVVMEEQALQGGLGSAIAEYCVQHGLRGPVHLFALPDRFAPQGAHDAVLKSLGLEGEQMAEQIARLMEQSA